VYNGKPTRNFINKDDSASPTAANESINITCCIDVHESRDIMSADIPNAFVQTKLPSKNKKGKKVMMEITGVLVDKLVELNPQLFTSFVTRENNRKVIYVVVLRALYGMLVASLLWYQKFRRDLEAIGFKFNVYDPCVANRIVNGKQHTIRFHVDDVLSSHVDSNVNDQFLKWLNEMYGSLKRVSATRGNKHRYLGMVIDFSCKGKVKFKMDDYVEEMLSEFP